MLLAVRKINRFQGQFKRAISPLPHIPVPQQTFLHKSLHIIANIDTLEHSFYLPGRQIRSAAPPLSCKQHPNESVHEWYSSAPAA